MTGGLENLEIPKGVQGETGKLVTREYEQEKFLEYYLPDICTKKI